MPIQDAAHEVFEPVENPESAAGYDPLPPVETPLTLPQRAEHPAPPAADEAIAEEPVAPAENSKTPADVILQFSIDTDPSESQPPAENEDTSDPVETSDHTSEEQEEITPQAGDAGGGDRNDELPRTGGAGSGSADGGDKDRAYKDSGSEDGGDKGDPESGDDQEPQANPFIERVAKLERAAADAAQARSVRDRALDHLKQDVTREEEGWEAIHANHIKASIAFRDELDAVAAVLADQPEGTANIPSPLKDLLDAKAAHDAASAKLAEYDPEVSRAEEAAFERLGEASSAYREYALETAEAKQAAPADTAPAHPLSVQGYTDAFRHEQPVELAPDSPIRGRIMRGKDDNEFKRLALDDRRLVFIMGPDGLSGLPGRPLRSALGDIGLMPDYVQGRIDQGYQFKLLVFGGGHEAPLATWDNTLDLVQQTYPELADDVETHRQALKDTSFEAFAARMPEDMDIIDLAGEAHPMFLSLERYLQIPAKERSQDPLALRRVLLHEVHLGSLFGGDGYTHTPDGTVGLAEYLVPNGSVAQLQDAEVIDLALNPPR